MRARIGHPRLGAFFLMIVASLAAASAVSAHAEVVTATPAQGSTVTEPVTQVVVTYSEGLDPDSRLGILDTSGNRIAVGMPDSAGSQRMVATLDPALTSGTYTVRSTSIATDGHLERTQWTFTVNVPASPEPTPTGQASGEPSVAPSLTPSAPPSLAPSPSPSASPPPDTSNTSGSDAIVPIIAALAIVALGGVFLMTRGRRSGSRP
jgi:methionine-rich copper-binding protein CopC